MKNKFVYANKNINNIQLHDVGIIIEVKESDYKIKFIFQNTELLVSCEVVTSFEIAETGDQYTHKICDRCFKYLSVDDFSNNRIKKDNIITKRPSCKDCRKIKDGKAIPKKIKKEWEKHRPQNYTLFSCPICQKTTIAGISKHVLDHCHTTGKPRGYLCESCNTGIGRFDDEVDILKHAIKWLDGDN